MIWKMLNSFYHPNDKQCYWSIHFEKILNNKDFEFWSNFRTFYGYKKNADFYAFLGNMIRAGTWWLFKFSSTWNDKESQATREIYSHKIDTCRFSLLNNFLFAFFWKVFFVNSKQLTLLTIQYLNSTNYNRGSSACIFFILLDQSKLY